MEREELGSYLKRISERMFGRPSAYPDTQTERPVYPIGVIVADLSRLKEPDWAEYAFSREPLRGKLDHGQRLALTVEALTCGAATADHLAAQHQTSNPAELARKLGLDLAYPTMPQDVSRVLFAEFRPPKQINVFADGLDKAKALLGQPGVAEILGGELPIDQILIAHELFHYIEEEQKDIWPKTYKIKLWGLGPIQNFSTISVLSEIAAMGFCKRLTHLPHSPYLLDAFLMYGYSPAAASGLYEEMMTLAGQPLPNAKEQGA